MKIKSRVAPEPATVGDFDVLQLINDQASHLSCYPTAAEGVAHIAGLLAGVGSVDHIVDVRVGHGTNFEVRAFSVSWRMRLADPFTNATVSVVA